MSETPFWKTLDEVAAAINLSPRKLRSVIKEHNIPAMRTGRLMFLDDVSMGALKDALRLTPTPALRLPLRQRRSDMARALKVTAARLNGQ